MIAEHRLVHEVQTPDGWVPRPDLEPLGPSPFSPDHELAMAEEHRRAGGEVLPFQPLSFRDFMVFEQHTIDASRGLVRRFHPAQHAAATSIERLLRRPFPAFRPHRLFHEQPMYYMSNHVTFLPSGTPVAAPSYSDALDFELELGFVLAAPLRDASEQEAEAAIGAYVVLNDLSARDVQRTEMASGFGPQKSKHFASSISQEAVTPDEVDVAALTGSVAVNDIEISTVETTGMRWSPAQMLAHASRSETLRPGELFATGTLPGGSGMELGYWMQPGDRITLTLDGIGSVVHDVREGRAEVSAVP